MRAVFLDFRTVSNGDIDTAALDAVLPGCIYYDTTSPLLTVGKSKPLA